MPSRSPSRRQADNEHLRTRRDHASELAEDYVEAIAEIVERTGFCRVTDLAERFAVSHVSVNRAIARLKRDGFVEAHPYGPVHLTASGSRLAQHSRDRHRIVLEFLRALGVSEKTAALDAEGLEHHVSSETLRKMKAFAVDRATDG
ncbi:MAG: manganese-binding transcriptional regulator MntR [Pirellulales bacterium]